MPNSKKQRSNWPQANVSNLILSNWASNVITGRIEQVRRILRRFPELPDQSNTGDSTPSTLCSFGEVVVYCMWIFLSGKI